MENASKALIIAGAILIAILLIAVGMVVFNSARGTIDESIAQLSSQEIQMFNQQWTQYTGTRVSGSVVLTLKDKVEANNVIYTSGTGVRTDNKNIEWINNSGEDIKKSNFYQVKTLKRVNGLIFTIIIE